MNKHLETIKEITDYLKWSEDKLFSVMMKHDDFPVRKIQGRWTSHTQLLDTWFQAQIMSTRKTS